MTVRGVDDQHKTLNSHRKHQYSIYSYRIANFKIQHRPSVPFGMAMVRWHLCSRSNRKWLGPKSERERRARVTQEEA